MGRPRRNQKRLERKARCNTKGREFDVVAGIDESPRFGVSSLIDLVETWIGAANPIAGFVDFSRIHRDGAWNLLASCYHLTFKFHRFPAFDWKFPMVPESVERIIHGLGFDRAHTAATHRIVKHAVAILPRTVVLPVSDVVQHGSVPIFPFKWPAHDRPE